ncbi:protein ANTAGONIST OF LIKE HETEROCHROMATIN PROTEIN 1 [Elysia marginata]|uniref:Protein ANTAGONIST OF LIKE HETEROCHROMATIN PROTEIN 1 n=1 Tax=Elysia marginata TaxID=1093978 RepID=A0AAV4IRZ6_9GAST|nr:protein ANTAGONIST OF LIKE HETEROCHROMATIN PROTEIN 1 [Elysia marginata]
MFNYKKFFSVILQGVSDAKYRFINIDVGGYGKQSDGGTFHASELYRALTDGKINLPRPSVLPQTDVIAPHVLIGDEAYPLLPFVLKPYSGTNLPVEKECFNKRLSRSRKTIECAFGLLTSKWHVLAKGIETRVDMVDSIVKCVCILHNAVIDKDGFQLNLTDVSVRSVFWQHSGRPPNEAKSIRDIFTTYFAHNPLTYE